jgi:prepilin-type N-terminal cleavage/methylation domain-containing protein
MATRQKFSLSQKGFTLVELLIVIVIIGILAGVVIGVLNPVQQQNRARDASIRAQLDKMALSTKSLYASSPRNTNRSPTQAEFIGGIANVGAVNNCTGNDSTASQRCSFTLSGITLSSTCGTGDYSGTGTADCHFTYTRTPTNFSIAAKGMAAPASVFLYTYTEDAATGNVTEAFYTCPTTFAFDASFLPTLTGCTQTN